MDKTWTTPEINSQRIFVLKYLYLLCVRDYALGNRLTDISVTCSCFLYDCGVSIFQFLYHSHNRNTIIEAI